MSHKPTGAEVNAALGVWHDPHLGTMTHALTAANAIRDKRIRNEAMEEAARTYEMGTDWDVFRSAAEAIRALKDKEPNHE